MKRSNLAFILTALGYMAAASPLANAEPSKFGNPRALQGPMLGPVSATEAVVWLRASGEFPVTVEYGTQKDLKDAQKTPPLNAELKNDLIVVQRLTGLQPATTYYYRTRVNGADDAYLGKKPFSFRTATAEKGKFGFAFGSCARLQADPVQKIWNTVGTLKPDLFLWLGDNIYADTLESSVIAEIYRYQRMVPSLQPVLRSVSQLAIWDDHDYGLNDNDRNHPRKAEALGVFKQYWPNPAYGLADTPGVFFTHHYAGVDFFFLDGRYDRDANEADDTNEKTMLGAKQLTWLESELKKSKGIFKIIVSGSGWSKEKGPGQDAWSGFLHERDRIFDFIAKEKVSGVVLLSGDTHMGECNCIPWSDKGGYDYYELVSSPLAQEAGKGGDKMHPEVRMRKVFEHPNVGFVSIDTAATPATLSYNLYGEDGKPAWEPLTINADELKNGVKSWATHNPVAPK